MHLHDCKDKCNGVGDCNGGEVCNSTGQCEKPQCRRDEDCKQKEKKLLHCVGFNCVPKNDCTSKNCPPGSSTYHDIECSCVAAPACEEETNGCPRGYDCEKNEGICLPRRKIICRGHDDCDNGRLCNPIYKKCMICLLYTSPSPRDS